MTAEEIKELPQAEQMMALSAIEKQLSANVRNLFKEKRPTRQQFEELQPGELKEARRHISLIAQATTYDVRDFHLEQLADIIDGWEAIDIHDRSIITQTIKYFVKETGRLPTINELSTKTGYIGVKTIKRLLPEGDYNTACFKLLKDAVMASVFCAATAIDDQGRYNAAAQRLYLEAMGVINGPAIRTVNNTQNNYLQINNTILSQQTIEALPIEQKNLIEGIITGRVRQAQDMEFTEVKKQKTKNPSINTKK